MSVEVGSEAPDFSLKGPGGQPVTLSEYRGRKNVVLVFYPLDFSPVCSHQLPELQREKRRFDALDAEILGISVDSHYAHEEFGRQLGLEFALLSDLRREVSRRYGVLREQAGVTDRAVFVIDKAGVVRYKFVSPDAGRMDQVPAHEPILAALARLP